MAHRTLTLLFFTTFGLACLSGAHCQVQQGMQYPIQPTHGPHSTAGINGFGSSLEGARLTSGQVSPATEWRLPAQAADDRRPPATAVSTDDSTYHPLRIDAARRSANESRSKYSPTAPMIAELAKTNASLADQWSELAEQINAVGVRVAHANARLIAASRDYEQVNAKLQQYGLTPSMGLLLNHKKSQLEDWQVEGSVDHCVNDEIQRSREKQVANGLIAYDGSDIARQTTELLASSGFGSNHVEHATLTAQIQTLLRERSEWFRLLTRGYNDYRHKLGELDSASTAFDKLASDYHQLINRHVTWIRSGDPLGIADLQKLQRGLGSLFDSRRSAEFGYALRQKWNSNPSSGLLLLGTSLLVLLLRFLAKSWLVGIGRRKKMRGASSAARKCAASLLTPLVAAGFPCVLYLMARWFGSGYVTESLLYISSALYAASLVSLIVEVPRQLLRTHGFVERHLKIDLPRRQRASVYLLIIGTGLVLAAFIVTLAERIDHGIWSGSVARIGFIAALLLVAWTAHLALSPSRGFLLPLINRFGGTLLYRIRTLFYCLGVGAPFAIITLSALGYGFTAKEVSLRAGLMFVSIVVGATFWSALKILSSGAWHALTGTRDERHWDEAEVLQSTVVSGALAEHSLELKHQIAFLGQCGLVVASIVGTGWLWIDILPSVRMGNPVVWNIQESVSRAAVDASGRLVSRSETLTTPITLLHLGLASVILFVAFQLAKLLPGIFDALVLQRVNFDEAMEHLSLVVGRCLLFGTGCFIAGRLVGLRWEAIQWLAVGLTIGMGFALQDVVRNLLGGLVVLFEKPVRLGDLITVGNITGRVAAQKLRTTILFDGQGREVIIPNKNFVSKDVINWMGAGRLKSIIVEVAVTRDERPVDVCRMLQQLMVEQPYLLLSPAPQATLICISQQSQRIEVSGWIEEDQDALRYRDALTRTILEFLATKNLLANDQPRQPLLDDSVDVGSNRLNGKRRKRPA